MQKIEPHYISLLKSELTRRKAKNAQYSLRAFALSLGISASVLSRALTQTTPLTLKLAAKVVEKLNLGEIEESAFIDSVSTENLNARKKQLPKKSDHHLSASGTSTLTEIDLTSEIFTAISEIHHFAILEMTNLSQFQFDADWIANELGIDSKKANEALARLIKLKMLKKGTDGKYRKAAQWVQSFDQNVTSDSRRKHQNSILNKSIEALETVPIEDRAHYAGMFAIQNQRLPRMKLLIESVIKQFGNLSTEKTADQVYCLNISLFPLQKGQNHHEHHSDSDQSA